MVVVVIPMLAFLTVGHFSLILNEMLSLDLFGKEKGTFEMEILRLEEEDICCNSSSGDTTWIDYRHAIRPSWQQILTQDNDTVVPNLLQVPPPSA